MQIEKEQMKKTMNTNVGKKSGEKRELLLQNKLWMWLFPFCHVFFLILL